jgi:hypothetical protein
MAAENRHPGAYRTGQVDRADWNKCHIGLPRHEN